MYSICCYHDLSTSHLGFSCQDRQEAVILANAISVSKLADSMTNAISWARVSIQGKMESRFDLEVAEKFVVLAGLRKGVVLHTRR
jgi:hypothetical protein